jgi:hypothetical protein
MIFVLQKYGSRQNYANIFDKIRYHLDKSVNSCFADDEYSWQAESFSWNLGTGFAVIGVLTEPI